MNFLQILIVCLKMQIRNYRSLQPFVIYKTWHLPPKEKSIILHQKDVKHVLDKVIGQREGSLLRIQYILSMITLKSSPKVQRGSAKILTLQIAPESQEASKITRLISHKIKKLQHPDLKRHSKAVNILQNLQFLDFLPSATLSPRLHQESPRNKTGRISSYLAYKEEQKVLRVKHNNKISFLKNKYMQQKTAEHSRDAHHLSERQICTQGTPRGGRKISCIMLEATVSEENETSSVLSRSREGKRQKVDTHLYMRKIKAKFDTNKSLQPRINVSFARFPQYIESQAIFPIKSYSNDAHQSKPTTACSTFRKLRNRNIKKEKLLASPDDGVTCRPWSSDKSQLLEE